MNPNPFCLMIFLIVPVMATFSSLLSQLSPSESLAWSLTTLRSLPTFDASSTYIQKQLEFNSLLYYWPRVRACSSFQPSHWQSEKGLSRSEDSRSYHST